MANMTFKTNILPNSNLEYNLGSTVKKWNIYGRLITSSKDIANFDKLIITDGNDYYSSNTTFDGTTENQYLTKKGTFKVAPVESVAGMSGNVSLYTLAVGSKSYNGSENIVVTMADLGISSAMRFLGVTDSQVTEGSVINPVNIVSGGSLGEATASNGDVVLTQSNQIEYIYTGSEWKELGLASSYALRHHAHGNILTNGIITSDTTVASGNKIVITDASNKVSRSNISFGTDTTKALSNAGTWIDVNNYVLPTASDSIKGGVKIGSGLTMTGEILSANVTGVKGNAETNYRTGNINLTAANIGAAAADHNHDSTYVNVTGDTMTGNLTIKTANNPCLNLTNTDMDTHATSLTAAEYDSVYFRDKNSENNLSGWIQTTQATNGNVTLTMASRRRNTANDANVTNAINLTTAADGTLSVSVSTPAGWRSAIGAAASDHSHNSIKDRTNNTLTYSNYGAAGLAASAITWLTCWNGYELRAISKAEMANAVDSAHKWVRLTGDTMTGLLKINTNSNTVTIGSQNSSYCHISNSANIPFYFNKTVQIDGQMIQYTNAVASQSWINGRDTAAVRVARFNNYHAGLSMKTTNGSYEIGVYTDNNFWITYCPDAQYNAGSNTNYKQVHMTSSGQWYGAVWNDYAEFRKNNPKEKQEPGRCVREIGDGTLALTTERLMRGCEIISDTFGFAIGQDENKGYDTPIASNGRVLAYPYESIDEFRKHIGYCVCSGPNGTVSIMTDEEEEKYPGRIIGTISEIPDYEVWGTGEVKVNGRVWIRIR